MAEYIERGEAIMTLLQGGCYASNIEDIMNIHAADVVPARHGHCMGSDRKITNADMIRAMSDEELDEVFCNADWCNACGQLKQDGTCRAMEMGGELDTYCKAGCLTWLRQSAVEEAR